MHKFHKIYPHHQLFDAKYCEKNDWIFKLHLTTAISELFSQNTLKNFKKMAATTWDIDYGDNTEKWLLIP